MNREIARECLTNGGRKTSEEEIDRFMKAFEEGTPVLPIRFFCDALTKWATIFGEKLRVPTEAWTRPQDPHYFERENESRRKFSEQAHQVFLKIRKSNLLWRMLYEGEKPRSNPCPHHNGRWSGCKLPEEMECKGACADGLNVTGWLREE